MDTAVCDVCGEVFPSNTMKHIPAIGYICNRATECVPFWKKGGLGKMMPENSFPFPEPTGITPEEEEALELVSSFFDGNEKKVYFWFRLPNPLLGGISPVMMIYMHREKKLLEFIKHQLDGGVL